MASHSAHNIVHYKLGRVLNSNQRHIPTVIKSLDVLGPDRPDPLYGHCG